MLTLRREHRRFAILGGVVLLIVMLAIQDRMLSPKIGYSCPETHVSHGEQAAIKEDLALHVGEGNRHHGKSAPHAKIASKHHRPTTLRPAEAQTTIPEVLASLDSNEKAKAWSAGFTLLDNLYVRNGMFYIVTDNAKDFPEKNLIMTDVVIIGEKGQPNRDGSEFLTFITTEEAKKVLGDTAKVIPGVTMFVTDPPKFLSHYFHFWGEVVLGAWKVYSALAFSKDTSALDRLPFPDRWVLPFIDHDAGWRDRAGLNGPFLRVAFPNASISKSDLWTDWMKLGGTYVFERSMLINRMAAHKSPIRRGFNKMMAGTEALNVPKNYWEPVRRKFTKELFGYIPQVGSDGKPLVAPHFKVRHEAGTNLKPIVTYISRQSTSRRLLAPDHELLVTALKGLEDEGVCEVRIPVMEDMTLPEQMAEIASSTIIVGVHGNGLTHQMFMPPSLRSAVFEIQPPGDWAADYWMLARNIGHKHYMVRNDTLLTYSPDDFPSPKNIHMGPLFHSKEIPVFGQVVADAIRKRLTQTESEVEP